MPSNPLTEPYMGPDTPGPGHYAIGSTLEDTIGFSIQGRPREIKYDKTPGPGAYTPMFRSDVPRYSMAGRYVSTQNSSMPGPNQYSPRDMNTTEKIKIKGRWRDVSGDNPSPGPKYLVPSSVGKGVNPGYEDAPAYSLSGRPEPKRPRRSDGPGPAAVNLRRGFSRNAGPAYTMRMKTEPDFGNAGDIPGPGQYPVRSTVGDGPKKTIGKPRGDRLLAYNDTPGPGAYSIPRESGIAGDTSPRFSFAPRDRKRTEGYSATYKSRSSSFAPNTDSPGPLAYNVRSNPINTSTGKSFGKKLPDVLSRTAAPGPGKYTPGFETTSRSPRYSFGLRLKDLSEKNTTPGPGTYETVRAIGDSQVFENTGAFSMAGRETYEKEKDGPGPGAYMTSRGTLGGPSATLKGKWSEIKPTLNAPGPGAYKPEPHDHIPSPRLHSDRPSLFTVPRNSTHFKGLDAKSKKPKTPKQ